jgi:hypothetical protein
MDVLETESPFIAHEVTLGLWILSRPQTVNLVLRLVDMDAAAGRASGADALSMLQPPNTFLVKEILAAQSPYRTQVDHVTSQLVIAGFDREIHRSLHGYRGRPLAVRTCR